MPRGWLLAWTALLAAAGFACLLAWTARAEGFGGPAGFPAQGLSTRPRYDGDRVPPRVAFRYAADGGVRGPIDPDNMYGWCRARRGPPGDPDDGEWPGADEVRLHVGSA
jgi:hypothetical protein